MEEPFIFHQTTIRLSIFLALFVLLSLFENWKPRLTLSVSKTFRWMSNVGLTFANTLVVRLVAPMTPIAMALWVQEKEWGVLHQVQIFEPLEILVALLILDFLIYWQHVLFHKVPLFWRLHHVHHTDLNIDVTTGIRFHPGEILLSLAIKMATIFLLGVSPLSVLIFEVVLNATSMFNHSNLHIPEKGDAFLRKFIVTPDMHRVHHSILSHETNSNYGFNVPWWDWLFHTYRPQPQAGHEQMTLGLSEFQQERQMHLLWLLWLPFRRKQKPSALSSEQ